MRRAALVLLPLVIVASVAPARARSLPPRDEAAVSAALLGGLGGDAAWARARYLRFDFIVEKEGKKVLARAHAWDRHTGRYRVELVDQDARYAVHFNVGTRAGEVLRDGKRLGADEAKKWLEQGYEAFINDTYWLLAPYKILDAGVHRTYEGEERGPAGEARDVLKLHFDQVGLTPRDVYWLHVDRATQLVVEWRYILDGGKGPPTAWTWSDWRQVGPLRLAATRRMVGKPVVIRFEQLTVSEQPDEAALALPR